MHQTASEGTRLLLTLCITKSGQYFMHQTVSEGARLLLTLCITKSDIVYYKKRTVFHASNSIRGRTTVTDIVCYKEQKHYTQKPPVGIDGFHLTTTNFMAEKSISSKSSASVPFRSVMTSISPFNV